MGPACQSVWWSAARESSINKKEKVQYGIRFYHHYRPLRLRLQQMSGNAEN